MGVQKKTRKFAETKRIISQRDSRLAKNIKKDQPEKKESDAILREVPQMSSAMFFQYNQALGTKNEDQQLKKLTVYSTSIQRPS